MPRGHQLKANRETIAHEEYQAARQWVDRQTSALRGAQSLGYALLGRPLSRDRRSRHVSCRARHTFRARQVHARTTQMLRGRKDTGKHEGKVKFAESDLEQSQRYEGSRAICSQEGWGQRRKHTQGPCSGQVQEE